MNESLFFWLFSVVALPVALIWTWNGYKTGRVEVLMNYMGSIDRAEKPKRYKLAMAWNITMCVLLTITFAGFSCELATEAMQ